MAYYCATGDHFPPVTLACIRVTITLEIGQPLHMQERRILLCDNDGTPKTHLVDVSSPITAEQIAIAAADARRYCGDPFCRGYGEPCAWHDRADAEETERKARPISPRVIVQPLRPRRDRGEPHVKNNPYEQDGTHVHRQKERPRDYPAVQGGAAE